MTLTSSIPEILYGKQEGVGIFIHYHLSMMQYLRDTKITTYLFQEEAYYERAVQRVKFVCDWIYLQAEQEADMSEPVQLFLALGIMIATAKTFAFLMGQINQPSVLGELLAGVILGPSLLNFLGRSELFPDGEMLSGAIINFAEIGVLLLIFAAGLGIDPQSMLKVGRPALLTGVLGVIAPVLIIAPVATFFGYTLVKGVFVALVLAAMSTAISAQVMLELGVLRSREGLTLLGAALVDDLLVIFLVSLFLAINPRDVANLAETRPIIEVIVRMFLFLGLGSLLSWVLLPFLANRIQNLNISEGPLVVALVGMLLMAAAAEYIGGIAAIAGAFIAGFSLGRAKRNVVDRIAHGVHVINYSLLMPLFFIGIGLKADLRLLEGAVLPFATMMLVLAIVTKVIGAWIGTYLGGLDALSGLRVSLGMISRGEVGLIMATIGINAGIIAVEVFSVVVLIVLATAMITPPLMRWSFTAQAEKLLRSKVELKVG